MVKVKVHRRSIFYLTCIIFIAMILIGYSNKNGSKQHNKFGSISKNDIVSFKMHNIKAEQKEIKIGSDRDKIITLLNSITIKQKGVEPVDGVGFGVEITYESGEKFSASFSGNNMIYVTGGEGTVCSIDKDIIEDLRNYYNKN